MQARAFRARQKLLVLGQQSLGVLQGVAEHFPGVFQLDYFEFFFDELRDPPIVLFPCPIHCGTALFMEHVATSFSIAVSHHVSFALDCPNGFLCDDRLDYVPVNRFAICRCLML